MILQEDVSIKASIIIPGRSVKNSILECLASVRAQNLLLIHEIIVVENGSQELSKSLLGDGITLIHLKQGNRSKARNIGAEKAIAPILVFLDADVVLEEGWLEAILQPFKSGADAVLGPVVPSAKRLDLLHRFRMFRAMKRTKGSFISLRRQNSEDLVINSAAFAIRKDVFKGIGGFDTDLYRHEDLDLTQRLLRVPVQIKLIQKPCRVYFEGNLIQYFGREFSQALEKVRYHEKWDPKSWRGSFVLISHFFEWFKGLSKILSPNPLERIQVLVEGSALAGSLFGVFRKAMRPYPNQKMSAAPIIAKIEEQ